MTSHPSATTRRDLLAATTARLRAAGLDEPAREARLLVKAALGLTDADLIARDEVAVEDGHIVHLTALTSRRAGGEPLARLTGRREFWSLDLALSPDTLVPRPETEILVEAALAAFPERDSPLRILDLGTGSGAILAALLAERPAAYGVGVDRAEGAARQASINLERLGFSGRFGILVGEWAQAIGARFDLVVSNPPYIVTSDIATLEREVREHDPHLALDGGADGLEAYRAIAAALPGLLAPGGRVVLELGAGQEAAVAGLLRARNLTPTPARRDLAGIARAIVAEAP
ncbi:peptide chain release factor N(5)-glutamine methyltransferase [Ancylobacter lacus]|uniref:peptide chain release factor N(5)-glutamine methyltransferase n=1 Tax=Ancylobacter lacus TaxID=2579970 RepID=UPI001BD1A7E9|nr:peptide chain release factor N(5)-glutamine methyltransferase [Ancylobacter lacus]MBS7541136.1 peptide chain release factor N(5)-glutamine methyltransferase [Ancylobacter lacus]